MNNRFNVQTRGQGLYDITHKVMEAARSYEIDEALVTVFIRHTSASLLIQENADPAVQRDLQNWLSRLVPEDDALYTHVEEGPDDMPAHVKAALTQTHLNIPLCDGALALGTWQGVYLWEHRHADHTREVIVSAVGVL
ncbi:MAG: secondary thiamine-phosphate synthase enzyme YjbQ [Pseudomonadota bacterium]